MTAARVLLGALVACGGCHALFGFEGRAIDPQDVGVARDGGTKDVADGQASDRNSPDTCGASSIDAGVGWPRQLGGGLSAISGIGVDPSGNVTVAGHFSGRATFAGCVWQPQPGDQDVFIASFTREGRWRWAKRIVGGKASSRSLAVDSVGDVIVGGTFRGTAQFDNEKEVGAPGMDNGFVVKLAATDGRLLWRRAQYSARVTETLVSDVAVEATGRVAVVGEFVGRANFASPLIGKGERDIFVAAYTADGQLLWRAGFGDAATDHGRAVAFAFDGSVLAGGALGVGNGSKIWITRLDGKNGDVITTAGLPHSGAIDYVTRIAVDNTHAFIVGRANNAMVVARVALMNLTSVQWAYTTNVGNVSEGFDVRVDPQARVVVAGAFSKTTTIAAVPLTSVGNWDMLIVRHTVNGDVLGRWQAGTAGTIAEARALAFDGATTYVAGRFSGTVTLLGRTLTAAGSTDVVIFEQP